MHQEAFICDGIRTPIGRYGGSLSSVRPDDLGAHVIAALMARNTGVDWAQIDDVIFGNANQAGEDNRNVARMSALLAGLPVEVPGATINRLCGSGMHAIGMAAQAIAAGDAELMIAGGCESMSRAPIVVSKADQAFSRTQEIADTTIGWRFVNPAIEERYGVDSLPLTAENVAAKYGISRTDQDGFALRSQQRSAAAQEKGFLAGEIAAIEIHQRKGGPRLVEYDEHPRPDTTLEILKKLRPVTHAQGTVTAGNASGINDGAQAVLVASQVAVDEYRLCPIARILGMAVAGVEPRVMGIGPVPATRKLLGRLGLSIADMDVIELNEAFAAQALAVMRIFGLEDDAEHVNPNGGAIALGHPLGMSGARITYTAARELKRRRGKYALASMCIGVGQGIAMVIEAC